MPVHIGEMTTEVAAAPASTAPQGTPAADGDRDGSSPWPALERLRALTARLVREEARTRARGFDD